MFYILSAEDRSGRDTLNFVFMVLRGGLEYLLLVRSGGFHIILSCKVYGLPVL